MNNDYHGRSGCGWACGRRVFSGTFFFFTMVSNGVDAIRFLCSTLNVEVMEIGPDARAHAAERDHENGLSKYLCMCLFHCRCICTCKFVVCVCVPTERNAFVSVFGYVSKKAKETEEEKRGEERRLTACDKRIQLRQT